MIQDNLPVTIYTADGTQTEWNIPYQFSNAAEIALYISHNDVLTPINAADYLVDVEDATITYPVQAEGVEDPVTPVPQGDLVVIERANAITQEEDSTASLFKSPDVERIADKLTKICQELSYRLSRTISYNPTVPDAEIITDVSEFKADIQSDMNNAIAAHNSSNTAHTDIRSLISSHISNTANPHNVTKAQVGLGNVDNTADSDKPVSAATQNALDLKQDNLTNSQLAAVNSGIDSEQVDQIGINTNAIASEIADREDADTLLQNQITALLNNKQDNLTSIQLEAVNSGINSTKVAAIATNTSDIAAINAKIPSEASSTNKLADKTYVNDAVNSVAAYYVTANTQGESFATKAALVAGPWYYDGSLRTPTTNDYALVVADETHDGKSARYTYTGSQWAFQYIINTTALTQDQLNAIDSGITAAKVSSYDSHIINTSNPHSVTKSQVGLGNVDNTSDLSKPISTATQSALNALDAAKASNADDSTIIDNGATISTVAVKEQRANAVIKKWVGTKAQYDAIATKDANTTYIVTDEDDSALFVIDSALSSTSTNAVQNKVVKAALDTKQATITGGASTIASSNLTANRALVSNASGKVAVSSVTSTELGYVSGVTSAIQTQLNSKQATLPAGTTGHFLQKTATGVAWAEVQGGGGAAWGNITGTLNDQTDLQNALNSKQDAISDLATIRSGASAGATALQNTATATNSLTINGVANTASATSVNIGDNSQAVGGQCVAIGSGSTTSNAAYANTNCVAIGFASRANYASGTAIGRETETTGNNGVAVGYESVATTNAVAIGKTAKATAQSAIQIGTGTNSTANTFQVFNTTVVDANGKVPTASLEADLTTKANTALSNVTNTGKSTGAGWGMPSGTYEDLTLGASGTTYTAPANGWLFIAKAATDSNQYLDIEYTQNSTTLIINSGNSVGNGEVVRILTPVLKGQDVNINYSLGGATSYFRFFYAEGSKSEAN